MKPQHFHFQIHERNEKSLAYFRTLHVATVLEDPGVSPN